jgi:predicted signal transduction protein with EAL and GGDEF domain
VSTSIYAMALAGAVVVHVLFLTLDQDTTNSRNNNIDEVVEKRRKRLLLFAILVATITTYQAGLGFRVNDDDGHHAGDPVLLNFPRRYKAFFYCNSVSFMLSMAMTVLLVNKNLYKPAIQSHAISQACSALWVPMPPVARSI